MPSISTSLPEAGGAKAEDITEASGSGTDRMCPHEFQASLRSGAAALTTDTSMASGGIADHGSPSRSSNPESQPLLLQIRGMSLHLHKLQAVVLMA